MEKCSELAVEEGYCNKHYLEWLGAENGATVETPEEPGEPSEAPAPDPTAELADVPDIVGQWQYKETFIKEDGVTKYDDGLAKHTWNTWEFTEDGKFRKYLSETGETYGSGTYIYDGKQFVCSVTEGSGILGDELVRFIDDSTLQVDMPTRIHTLVR